ncbi:adenine phosphoribosyltransferase 1-like [Silene latifolia]|uniref:adenine phosphoribosyltransferase 1-like n=1 Tax=Silene latifolia TaxID=37657 RepID=UPI003D778163
MYPLTLRYFSTITGVNSIFPRAYPSLSKPCSTKLTPYNSSLHSHFVHYSSSLSQRSNCVKGDQSSKMALDSEVSQDDRIAKIASTIRIIPNFPKPGIMFQDITTMLLDPQAFKDTIDLFVERYKGKDIAVVAGVEARGFIFGPPIALAIGAKFVPMRKPGKLPGDVISEEYSLEYGTDKMEMHVGAVEAGERAIVIDDLIATGGTLSAAIKLLERVGVNVVESACLIELAELKGRERLGDHPLFVLIKSA